MMDIDTFGSSPNQRALYLAHTKLGPVQGLRREVCMSFACWIGSANKLAHSIDSSWARERGMREIVQPRAAVWLCVSVSDPAL